MFFDLTYHPILSILFNHYIVVPATGELSPIYFKDLRVKVITSNVLGEKTTRNKVESNPS